MPETSDRTAPTHQCRCCQRWLPQSAVVRVYGLVWLCRDHDECRENTTWFTLEEIQR